MALYLYSTEELLHELIQRNGKYCGSIGVECIVPIGREYSATITAAWASLDELNRIMAAKAEDSK